MKSSDINKHSKLKRCLVIITILIFFLIKKYASISYMNFYDNDNMLCVSDYSYTFTNFFYNILRTHSNFRILCQTFFSFFLDMDIVIISYLWISRAKNWRIIMTLVLLFSFREIITQIYQIKLDEDLIWGYAGIPSLMVSYHKNKTFFFSGTLSLYFICAVELRNYEFSKLSIFTYILTILYAVFLLSLRAQYFIGIFCSLISAHYFHILSENYCYILNDLYDFDTETTNKNKQIEFEKNLKVIVENTIKENRKEKNIGYERLASSTGNLEL